MTKRKIKPVGVSIMLAPDVVAAAEKQAQEGGFLGLSDYLTALVNRAVLEDQDRSGDLKPLSREDWESL